MDKEVVQRIRSRMTTLDKTKVPEDKKQAKGSKNKSEIGNTYMYEYNKEHRSTIIAISPRSTI